MAETVAQMTKEELGSLIESIVEKKLLEIFGDPDEGQKIKEYVRKRLVRQVDAVSAGERGPCFDNVVERVS